MRLLLASILVLAALACGCSQEAGTPLAAAPPPLASAAAPSSSTPTQVQQVLVPGAGARTPEELSAWTQSSAKTPVRYAALRELERRDPARAVEVAAELLDDSDAEAFLRQNAIAVLARAGTSEAEAALGGLSDAAERNLASRLLAREGR